jgi:hypothetical protein
VNVSAKSLFSTPGDWSSPSPTPSRFEEPKSDILQTPCSHRTLSVSPSSIAERCQCISAGSHGRNLTIHKTVRWFHVAMHDRCPVKERKSKKDLPHDDRERMLWDGTMLAQTRVESTIFTEF